MSQPNRHAPLEEALREEARNHTVSAPDRLRTSVLQTLEQAPPARPAGAWPRLVWAAGAVAILVFSAILVWNVPQPGPGTARAASAPAVNLELARNMGSLTGQAPSLATGVLQREVDLVTEDLSSAAHFLAGRWSGSLAALGSADL